MRIRFLHRVTINQEATPDGISAEVKISNVDSSDTGPYFCQANNLYGRDQQLVQLQVQEPPQAPASLTAAIITSRSVNLKWTPRGGDAAEVSKYIVEYMEVDRQWNQIEVSDTQYSAIIENLKPATKYLFRVIAEGPAGQSIPSQELDVKTEPQRPAGTPLSLSARPMSSTEILVSWMAPLAELRHGDILGYNVGYIATASGTSNYNYTSVSGDAEDGLGEMLLAGLAKYTRYTIVVQAFNQVGLGPISEPTTAQTLEDGKLSSCVSLSLTLSCSPSHSHAVVAIQWNTEPDAQPLYLFLLFRDLVPSVAPEHIRCAPLTSQSLQISWQPPPQQHTNGLLQGYKVNFEYVSDSMGTENDEMDTRKTTESTIVLTGLRKFTNYSVQVLAYTRIGDGVFSAPIHCKTEEDGN